MSIFLTHDKHLQKASAKSLTTVFDPIEPIMDAATTDTARGFVLSLVEVHGVYKLLAIACLTIAVLRWFWPACKKTSLPVWAPIEIALTSFIVGRGGFSLRILQFTRRRNGSLFGLTSKHQVLVNLPNMDRLMVQSFHALSAEPIQYTIFTRVFGAADSPQLRRKVKIAWKQLLKPIEDMFLNDAAAKAALESADMPAKASNFLSFAAQAKELQLWERSANISIVQPTEPSSGQGQEAMEADLHSLLRDFGACVAIPLLYGTDFLRRYTRLLEDLWRFDNDVLPLLVIGIPSWAPFGMMRKGVAARSRLLKEMAALYRRIDQYQHDEPVDFGADMSDIRKVALERNRVYTAQAWSFEERGAGDLAILWGQNANTQPIFFWLLVYVYSMPGLLDRLRDEVAPYVLLRYGGQLEIERMEFAGLFGSCPLLKACIFETYRMANEPTSIRSVKRPITIRDGTLQHDLRPGMCISVPHAVNQRDPSIYSDPDQFIPDRFLERDSGTGKISARYGRLRPWGVGAAMCKGRNFAEKEIVALAAAILSLWDISPVNGRWEVPAMVPGTGAKKPVKDIRVKIRRRGKLDGWD